MASEKLFREAPPFPEDVATAHMCTISLTQLMKNDEETANKLLNACQELGFFSLDLRGNQLGNTLVEEIDELFKLSRELMHLSEEEKSRYQHNPPQSLLGFKPRGSAKIETNEPDRFEWFNLSQDELLGNSQRQPIPQLLEIHRGLLKSFLDHGQAIVSMVCQTLATQLLLPPSTFMDLQRPDKPSGTVVRFIRAFASPEGDELRTNMVHHTDFGTITLLANVIGGLQILSPGKNPNDADGWLYARPQPGCLIVNLGDAMVQWTNGVLRSNCHRIRFAPGEQRFVDRYSLAILVRPEKEAKMKRLIDTQDGKEAEETDHLTAYEWEVQKSMALKRGENVMQSKGGRPIPVN